VADSEATDGSLLATLNLYSHATLDARHWSYGARKLLPVGAVRIEDQLRRAVTGADVELIRNGPDFDPFQLYNARYIDRVDRYFNHEAGGLD
jgi:hypothetical protein